MWSRSRRTASAKAPRYAVKMKPVATRTFTTRETGPSRRREICTRRDRIAGEWISRFIIPGLRKDSRTSAAALNSLQALFQAMHGVRFHSKKSLPCLFTLFDGEVGDYGSTARCSGFDVEQDNAASRAASVFPRPRKLVRRERLARRSRLRKRIAKEAVTAQNDESRWTGRRPDDETSPNGSRRFHAHAGRRRGWSRLRLLRLCRRQANGTESDLRLFPKLRLKPDGELARPCGLVKNASRGLPCPTCTAAVADAADDLEEGALRRADDVARPRRLDSCSCVSFTGPARRPISARAPLGEYFGNRRSFEEA